MRGSPHTDPSAGLYGSRTFVFTDDLDVTNRLYYYLLEAEGKKVRRGQVQARGSSGPLAALRRGEAFDGILAARRDGQIWDLPERIGHVLTSRPPRRANLVAGLRRLGGCPGRRRNSLT
jgi:hypothetical protein